MKTLVLSLLALSTLTAACSSSTGGTDSNGTSSSGSTAETSPEPTQPAPSYRVDCHGEATPLGAPVVLEVAPRCVGAEDSGTFCGDDPCAPDDATFSYAPPAYKCIATTVYAWDGKACVGHSTAGDGGSLHCTGKGCASLAKDEASCKAAHSACTGK